MIKIYGGKMSSAGRCYWAAAEAGVEVEEVPVDFKTGEHKSEAYLKLNPNGKVPTMQDGDFILWESLAINRYIAAKHKPELLGMGAENQALVDQWSFWSMAHLGKPIETIYIEANYGANNPEVIAKATKEVDPLFQILDNHLKGREFMVGTSFSLADIAIATAVEFAMWVKYDASRFPEVVRWVTAMGAREARQKETVQV